MWIIRSENWLDRRGARLVVELDLRPASMAEVVAGWRDDAAFRSAFNAALADSPFPAFRWETPAVTAPTAARPFECVLLDSPELQQEADPLPFADHFASKPEATVVAFPNLGRNAIMIVPCPLGPARFYGHLAAFVRQAPEPRRDDFWQRVGASMAERIGPRPVWLNTAGAGVAWLHVRLDDRPKYYRFDPYRSPV